MYIYIYIYISFLNKFNFDIYNIGTLTQNRMTVVEGNIYMSCNFYSIYRICCNHNKYYIFI